MHKYDPRSYDQRWHSPDSAAGQGGCSWHGPMGCPETPIISFRDETGARQSGCRRAVSELAERGEIDAFTARLYLGSDD